MGKVPGGCVGCSRRCGCWCLVLVAAALLAGVPAQADAAFTVSTYSVPVTTPDTLGASVSLDTDVYVPDGTSAARRLPAARDLPRRRFDQGQRLRRGARTPLRRRRIRGAELLGPRSRKLRRTDVGRGAGRDARPLRRDCMGARDRRLRSPPSGLPHRPRADRSAPGTRRAACTRTSARCGAHDPSINPYGISFRALEPGNTPDLVFEALVPNSVLKLSFGVGLIGTYFGGSTSGKIAPGGGQVDRHRGRRRASALRVRGPLRPIDSRHGDRARCSRTLHGARSAVSPSASGCPGSGHRHSMTASSRPTWRSRCGAARRTATSIGFTCRWVATPRLRRTKPVEQDRLDTQRRFLDAAMQGKALPKPSVVDWTRDPDGRGPGRLLRVPGGRVAPATADSWPPAKVADATYRLGADGSATQGSASSGVTYLSPLTEDARNDPVAAAALAGTPLGTSPLSSVPATSPPGFIASFRTPRSPPRRS